MGKVQGESKWYGGLVTVIAIGVMLTFTGCTQTVQSTQEKRNLEFTVMREADIPEELQTEMEKHKREGFRTTFRDTQYLYIAAGYGEQETSGYSVAVEELYQMGDNIYLKTKLIGPKKGENVNKVSSYPYLVIKLELREEDVLFE